LTRIDNAFDRRLLVAVDAAGYGAGTDQEHFAVQSGLTAVLDTAAARANLRRDRWAKQQAGDGELAILPRDEPEPVIVDQYVRYLDEALTAYNANPASRRKIRLRMAVHFGTAMLADNGYAGQGVVAVSRLVESAPVKNALTAAPQACLAVILSRQIFDDIVRQGHVSVPATDFARVSVRVKEFQDEAWVKVVGVPQHAAVEDRPADNRSPASSGTHADPGVYQQFYGDVHAPGATFGISRGA
jgi:class 3 adenylate cyclase